MNRTRIAKIVVTALMTLPLPGWCSQGKAAPPFEPEPGSTITAVPASEDMAGVVCSYAPSQSDAVRIMVAIASGHLDAADAVAQAMGLGAIAVHRYKGKGVLLKGAGRHIATRLGTAIVAPSVVSVSVMIGATATTLELLCVPRNHPEFVRQVEDAAIDFANRSRQSLPKIKDRLSVPRDAAIKLVRAGKDVLAGTSSN